MAELIKIEISNHIAKLTIDRPNALNAINGQVMQELNSFFSTGYKNIDTLYGVIITGGGNKAFVAGADIKEFENLDGIKAEKLSKFGHDTYYLIERFHVPVIAAINGFALGGGCELAMACHIRIANETAKFGQPEVNLGLVPGYGGSQRLIQLIGKGKAIELLMTADMIGAAEAYRLGLVNHVVSQGTEIEMAEKMIAKISTKGPNAIKKIIELVNAHFDPHKEAFDLEYKIFGSAMISEEAKEGAAAFVQKRKANFHRN
jgi:enoyl-CoA hydratase